MRREFAFVCLVAIACVLLSVHVEETSAAICCNNFLGNVARACCVVSCKAQNCGTGECKGQTCHCYRCANGGNIVIGK